MNLFWSKQRVLLTGHTGFKGAWAALWLEKLGAEVFGYALAPDQTPSLFGSMSRPVGVRSTIADLSDMSALRAAIADARPTVILHMAAKALVRQSYTEPLETFQTNLMGTVNVLEAARHAPGLLAVLVVTTDKVYANNDSGLAFSEDSRLGGHDPYSASKAAAEIATACYAQSFFAPRGISVATARGGNVIGGGDWSVDRIVPDVWRAAKDGVPIILRNAGSVRPWQHVLDLLSGYFLYIENLATGGSAPPTLNFGPSSDERVTVAQVAEAIGNGLGSAQPWMHAEGAHPPEMKTLVLNAEAAAASLGWRPRMNTRAALDFTTRWYSEFDRGADARSLCLSQIEHYESLP